jgi:Protein of unknown function DUF262/Protein of unknown function (DUF1524)
MVFERVTTVATRLDFSLTGIGALLLRGSYSVPIYQRSYAWGLEQVEDFWTDLLGALDGPDPEYFIGTVVLTQSEESGRLVIIDGQQRLATTSIMLAGLRDAATARGREGLANSIQTDFLSAYDYDADESLPRLVLNADDDDFFHSRIVDGDDASPVRESHSRIDDAFGVLSSRLTADIDSHGAQADSRLNSWLKFLREQVLVVMIVVPTESDAFLIFETLNARGAELTIGDLLKNYPFGRAGARLDRVRNAWVASLAHLDISAETELYLTFLRHHWSSMHGAVRERDLYRSIKEHVVTATQAATFADELENGARLYAALLNSSDDYWASLGTSGRNNVETLLRLELEQYRPLLLAVMQHFSASELKKGLRTMVSWAVRGLIVGGIGGGTYERAYCDAAVKVRAGTIKNTKQLLNELSPIVPSDDEFRAAFERARVTKARIARYILLTLERQERGDREPELVPNSDEAEVNLEHVLPRNARPKDWPGFPEDQMGGWVHRIGNFVLLSAGPNGRIGNKPWNVKRPVLQGSKLALTKAAAGRDAWTQQEISERQVELAALAPAAWPR